MYSADRFRSGGFSSFFVFQGALLVLLGVLIVMFPDLLRVMVATFFILIGLLVLGFGLTMRKMERGFPERQDPFTDI
jgi:cytochrome c biogenesis protein CcdA